MTNKKYDKFIEGRLSRVFYGDPEVLISRGGGGGTVIVLWAFFAIVLSWMPWLVIKAAIIPPMTVNAAMRTIASPGASAMITQAVIP